MRKIFSLLAVCFWLLAVQKTAFAQTATLSLDPSSGTFNKGCSTTVKINLDTGGAETDGADAILTFDSSRFTAVNITNGTIYPDYPGNYIDNAVGKITISGLASVATPFKGQGVLATVNFTVAGTAPEGATQMTLDFDPQDKSKTTDSNVVQRGTAVDVLNSVVDGNYIIGSGSCASPAPGITLPGTGRGQIATPAGSISTTIDDIVDQTGQGPGTIQLTSTLAIIGSILTILGILGLALL